MARAAPAARARRPRPSGAILIADDDAESRSLAAVVLERAGYDVIEVDNGNDAIDSARRALPLVAILEVSLPALSGYEVCHRLTREFPGVPIVLVSGERTESFDRVAGILIGADDYLVKPFAPDELLVRVRHLIGRATPIRPSVRSKLTARESEVLSCLADGLEPADIAARLVISPRTVGTHLENIMRKLGVRTRVQAVALAYREELVKSPAS